MTYPEHWLRAARVYAETKSVRVTADRIGMKKSGVLYALKGMNVVRHSNTRAGDENSSIKALKHLPDNHPRNLARNAEFLTEHYLVKKLSTTQIAELLNLTPSRITHGLRLCGIPVRTRAQGLKGRARVKARGENHRDWKGGITGWRKLARERLASVFVRPVMERDGFKCVWCGSPKKIVVHHHARSFVSIVQAVDKTLPLMEYVTAIVNEHCLEDGITLCKQCHDSWHREHGK